MNIKLIQYARIPFEHIGIETRDGQVVGLLGTGRHLRLDIEGLVGIRIHSERDPWIHESTSILRQLQKLSGAAEKIDFIDLKDDQRALVQIDGRFQSILGPGLYAFARNVMQVAVEVIDITSPRFVHSDLNVITRAASAATQLNQHDIVDGMVGVLYLDGAFHEVLPAGRHVFWKNVGVVKIYTHDLREKVLDVTGQDIMTADKVTLRLNAVVTYRITDVRLLAEATADAEQALYRELQLIIRAQIGGRTLDTVLSDKAAVTYEAQLALASKAADYGLEINGLGIRDIILPGDMKNILNQVIEAEKAAQANGIKRREETAAMRSQLNTAKLIEQNPILMRLRELEAVEKITDKADLQIFVGDGQGLSKNLIKMI